MAAKVAEAASSKIWSRDGGVDSRVGTIRSRKEVARVDPRVVQRVANPTPKWPLSAACRKALAGANRPQRVAQQRGRAACSRWKVGEVLDRRVTPPCMCPVSATEAQQALPVEKAFSLGAFIAGLLLGTLSPHIHNHHD